MRTIWGSWLVVVVVCLEGGGDVGMDVDVGVDIVGLRVVAARWDVDVRVHVQMYCS